MARLASAVAMATLGTAAGWATEADTGTEWATEVATAWAWAWEWDTDEAPPFTKAVTPPMAPSGGRTPTLVTALTGWGGMVGATAAAMVAMAAMAATAMAAMAECTKAPPRLREPPTHPIKDGTSQHSRRWHLRRPRAPSSNQLKPAPSKASRYGYREREIIYITLLPYPTRAPQKSSSSPCPPEPNPRGRPDQLIWVVRLELNSGIGR
mmetsp:Transcript_6270/g.15795  ORF Transcript_6270/g.15795 Transcript_6270/m.15795 type:complete len:209 (+) Transcript_6270:2288-2914(+)